MTMISETLSREEQAHLRAAVGTDEGYSIIQPQEVEEAVADVEKDLDINDSMTALRAYLATRGDTEADQANAARSMFYGARSSVAFLTRLVDNQSREMATLPENHPSEVVQQRVRRAEERMSGYWLSIQLRKEEMAMAEVAFYELTGEHINKVPEKRDRATIAADARKRAEKLREAAGLPPLDAAPPQEATQPPQRKKRWWHI